VSGLSQRDPAHSRSKYAPIYMHLWPTSNAGGGPVGYPAVAEGASLLGQVPRASGGDLMAHAQSGDGPPGRGVREDTITCMHDGGGGLPLYRV